MMFCDKCDRGYHTFCVGMDSIPTGEGIDHCQQTITIQSNRVVFASSCELIHILVVSGLWVCELCDKDFNTPKKRGGAKTAKKATSAKK